ncbi:restriction endonuclease subunit S [Bacillus altitudinis]|uniref:restriction endonuclease subunit S n=1 Tax=Bacillus altitudinis TaxID=293387 RepID=UPI002406963B|nr:restriction endonuclease subunit S [Bacillus altitudinis]MDF9415733.1 restriction endonuclease subunit S [Bacillus altitudinis]
MKRYEFYKESHHDFGEIPVNWNTTKLKFIASEDKNSFVDGPFGSDLKNEEYVESGIPVIQLNSIKEGKLRLNNFKYVSDEKASSLFRHTAFPGDLVIAKMAAPIARSAVVPATFEKYIIVADCIKLKTKEHQNVSFINYVMNTPFIVAQAERFSNGTTRSRVNLGIIKNLVIPLPSYEEQLEIVKFLDYKIQKIDQLIESVQKKVDLLEQQRQSIITEAVTKGLNPNVKMKDSGVEWIGDIPEHWKFTRLDFISRVKARLGWKGLKAEEYVEDGYAFLATPNLKERNIDFKNVNYITEERYLESPEIMLEVGDVLLAKDGSTLGIVNVVRSLPKNATVNSSIAVIRPTGKIDSVYFYYYLKSTYIQDVINQIKDGMGVPHLFQADIKKFKILLPPMDEQVVIAKYLDEETLILEQLVGKVKKQIEKLKEYRQSLIYEAVTGKIDVRDMELDEVR